MGVFKRGDVWHYRFAWRGELIRESTRQGNKRVAEQMQAARKTELAKGEVGIKRQRAPALRAFAEGWFLPFVQTQFKEKSKTAEYYRNGVAALLLFEPLARAPLDKITQAMISAFVSKLQGEKKKVTTVNRRLEVLRRMLKLAQDEGKVDCRLVRVRMLPGEHRRDRVLTAEEELSYLEAARTVGLQIEEDYERALQGIRATQRGEVPHKPADPYVLRDLVTVLADCGLRPDEAYRLRWDEIRDGNICVAHGKTLSARRMVPYSQRVAAALEMRRGNGSPWVFPAPTKSGHIEKTTIRKQHRKACKLAELEHFHMYVFRHTCLTRWAGFMDPYSLAHVAGHSDFATTKRYVHPSQETVRAAIDKAREAQEVQGRHKSSTMAENGAGKTSQGEGLIN